MSKRAYITRYSLLIKKLKQKPYATYFELQQFIDKQAEHFQLKDDTLNMGFSKRTLQRDIKEISNLFGIDIAFSKQAKGYFISNDAMANINFERMIDSFELFNSLHVAQDFSSFVFIEQRKPQGLENLYGIIHAIKNKLLIQFNYHKFWDAESSNRLVKPYALKEFKSRWYVLVEDMKDNQVKTFALDRISNFFITDKKFTTPLLTQIQEQFTFCFGIITPTDEKPQEIILSFDRVQGKYIKTLPLHHTQKVLIDDDKEIQVQLTLCITHDFIMEILSYGNYVKVIQPQQLINQIQQIYAAAINQY